MELAAMIVVINHDTYRSKPRQRIIDAINSAARRVYNWIVKETPGKHFLKWDTSITLVAGTNEYELPADCKSIARIREYDSRDGKWRIIHSTDFNDIARMEQNFAPLISFDDEQSYLRFYGPYRKNDGKYYITIEPAIDYGRTLELVYSAAFMEVTAEQDFFMMPEESRDVVKDFAIAELLDSNDDASGSTIEARGMRKLNEYLAYIRAMQTQDTPRQESYL